MTDNLASPRSQPQKGPTMVVFLINCAIVATLWVLYGQGAGLLALLLMVSSGAHALYLADKGQRDMDHIASAAMERDDRP